MVLAGAVQHGQQHRRAGVGGGREEAGGRICHDTGEGVDGSGGPEGLAGGAAREVQDARAAAGGLRQVLGLYTLRFSLCAG